MTLDRRAFIGAAGVAAIVPAAWLAPTGLAAGETRMPEIGGDRHVDDQWSGYPRYSDPIGYGRRTAPRLPEVHPADTQFVAF
jgi:hypothetical protein